MRGIFGKMWSRRRSPERAAAGGFLTRLSRDVRGNTLAIMAAALIPLCGLVGGGIDMSRMYITKTRLQHACDAGVLAGRKQMAAGIWGTDDDTVAKQFFDSNYLARSYGSAAAPTRAFSENAGKVTGTASVVLPMTLMRVLGKTDETLAVSCDAEMKLPNTDVMFVLDTTGSMNCVAGDASCYNNNGIPASGSKIDGLKTAVKCFYEILAQLNTDATCSTGTPSGGTSDAVQVRFGFVPYSSNVNVGRLLRSDWFTSSWTYQTRQRNGGGTGWSDWQYYTAGYWRNGCPTATNSTTTEYRLAQGYRYSGSVYYCSYETRYNGPSWNYGKLTVNTAALKSGTGWNPAYSFTQSINDDGSARTVNWSGCIEERASWGSSPAAFTAMPTVNDIAMRPTTDVNTMWHQALPDLIYYRKRLASNGSNDTLTNTPVTSYSRYSNDAGDYCPTEAKLLQEWKDPDVFDTYVDSLVAQGNTYHDIGMLWGARLMWPGGILDGNIIGPGGTAYADNTTASNGGTIQHHMIFMTDGDSTSNPCDYNSNGVPWFDQRQTTDVGAAADCDGVRQALVDQINNRLTALCTLVKNKGITLWVVSYGGGVNSATEARLSSCASDPDSVAATHYFSADDPPKLQLAFASIANSISQLRLTR